MLVPSLFGRLPMIFGIITVIGLWIREKFSIVFICIQKGIYNKNLLGFVVVYVPEQKCHQSVAYQLDLTTPD